MEAEVSALAERTVAAEGSATLAEHSPLARPLPPATRAAEAGMQLLVRQDSEEQVQDLEEQVQDSEEQVQDSEEQVQDTEEQVQDSEEQVQDTEEQV